MYNDAIRFFDSWNLIGGIGVLLVGAISFWFGGFTPQSVLGAVTGLYAFIAFNQMRESRLNRRPASRLAVRPHFVRDGDLETYDFGLKNFGDSPALNLRIKAVLREGNDSIATLMISAKDRHLHLEEKQFISLVVEASKHKSFGDLTDAGDSIYENCDNKYIEFYYTFESNDGIQYPRDWNNPIPMEMDEVIKNAESPRTVELTEIREKCTKEGEYSIIGPRPRGTPYLADST